MNVQAGSRPALANLTSLRFFAACYVLLFHTRGGVWFQSGFTGVTLFFVLSGFILAYNYPALPVSGRRRFYISRFARIYPLYIVAFLCSLPYFVTSNAGHGSGYEAAGILVYLAMLQTWWPPFHFVVNPGAWTLSVEACFYLIFPFLITRFSVLTRHWRVSVALLYAALLLPTVIGLLVIAPAFPAASDAINALLTLPVFHMGEFFIGIVFGLRFLKHRGTTSGWSVLAATVLCFASLALVGRMPHDDSAIVVDGVMALPYGILIYTMAGWKSRVFSSRILQLGGEISFSIYLLQWMFVDLVQRLFHHYRGLVPLRFLLFLFLAYLSYRFIERPCRSAILRMFGIHSHPRPIELVAPSS